MNKLNSKIDFTAIISVTMANPNGDPLNGNSPRTDYSGLGEMSDVCIKRKIRNRMQDLGQEIFVQSAERCADGYTSLDARAKSLGIDPAKQQDEFVAAALQKWIDVRSFGQVFALGKKNDGGVSIGIRGPVSVRQAVSVSPVEIADMQITKSVNGKEMKNPGERASDTMGMKHFVRFGLYRIDGAINVQLAEKTGFTEKDAEIIKECLRTLFVNDASAARPDGSMEVIKLFWWKHDCKDGRYSSAKVHRSVSVTLKDESVIPSSVEDYDIKYSALDGLEPEIVDGI